MDLSTDEAKLKALQTLIEAGKTGAEMAKILKVSTPTINNWKKKFGLSKPRGSKKTKKPVNASVRKVAKASSSSDAVAKIRQLLDLLESLPEGSANVRSAIKADIGDLLRSL